MATSKQKEDDKVTNVVQYKTEDGRIAFGAPDSRGAIEAKERGDKEVVAGKVAEKESTATAKA